MKDTGKRNSFPITSLLIPVIVGPIPIHQLFTRNFPHPKLMKIPLFFHFLISSTTGLGFRPMPPESNVESTLVWYKASSEENMKYWVDELDAQLKRKFFFFRG